jgi:hypothetical protein
MVTTTERKFAIKWLRYGNRRQHTQKQWLEGAMVTNQALAETA